MTEIVCRCEDITEEDILDAIDQGYTTLEEIKRVLRCGMGPCQGRTCIPLITRIVARKTGKSLAEVSRPTTRPPLQPLPLSVFAGEEE
ncbi:MAG: (2Fe-2S)-binding protein [Theionarchaea archaeon]|nr:(2Fe-2S)-binding protein [Theionarchaea archaeon]MBU7000896.1 (2Fe-2S)-binding protein [Theionarchaea archaeon]MBU7019891.1 (2Fe-2S)-binding protein [Theionarchaea archaeon]MBU7035972.1 (2Fe-2S)-binding protein [Theionarchaea archaeon]MBU7041816.1 (2Fe-2S)-binding protein [Theionarchaea archaeon]